MQSRDRNAPTDNAEAVRAAPLKVTAGTRQWDVDCPPIKWRLWGAAFQTIQFADRAAPFLPVTPLLKKGSEDEALNQDWAPIINRTKAILEPVGDGIFVHAEHPRRLVDRVAPANLDEAWIQPANSH